MNNIISPNFKTTTRLFQDYENYLLAHSDFVQELDDAGVLEFLRHPNGKFWEELLAQSFKKEYYKLFQEGKYFKGCPLKLFQDTYDYRLKKFISKNIDGREVDFILKQYTQLANYNFFPFLPEKLKENIKISLQKTKEYLITIAADLGYKIVWEEDNNGVKFKYEMIETISSNEVEAIEIIEESAVKKIIYLKELGIIELLVERSKANSGFSTNGIAKVLSAITGEKISTLQSALNPIGNLTVSQKNSPYNNPSNVEKVKLKLIEFGF